MNNEEKILQILGQMQVDFKDLKEGQGKLEVGQSKLEVGQAKLEKEMKAIKTDVKSIKSELSYIWEDIKKIDNRLSNQEQETFLLQRVNK